ncbi:trypsin-like cysteine/serine peptidase domain-containing protein [Kickxella alabastrina]|uniref:trypsin-like cysteine/serine peptidase domain-containing protein n=1 Tax=Kickxella alabastrina TaxID=61397 RepID=UPI00221FB7B2|nr:trypsin-like cysteine/serine peptidase domain-containing protein [Kickxella alabastrina]KAI7820899.1 trypsin-like cysteine/serine peptidase domain-containing protein [Kickxella alabastrina]
MISALQTLILLFGTTLGLSVPLLTNTAERIIGGQPSLPSAFPFAASLIIRLPGGTGFCGGTLISDTLVATAAHCVYNYSQGRPWPATAMRVGLNSNVLENQRALPVLQVYVHPAFDPREPKNDIAIVRIPSSGGVETARVFDGKLPSGTRLTAIGWGRTSAAPGSVLPSALQQTAIAVGETESCAQFVPGFKGSDGPQICTENRLLPGKDTCQGDSGTGVFVEDAGKMFLAGLTSYGANLNGDPTCALDDGFAVYTHVAFYRAFINSVVKSAAAARRRRRVARERARSTVTVLVPIMPVVAANAL